MVSQCDFYYDFFWHFVDKRQTCQISWFESYPSSNLAPILRSGIGRSDSGVLVRSIWSVDFYEHNSCFISYIFYIGHLWANLITCYCWFYIAEVFIETFCLQVFRIMKPTFPDKQRQDVLQYLSDVSRLCRSACLRGLLVCII